MHPTFKQISRWLSGCLKKTLYCGVWVIRSTPGAIYACIEVHGSPSEKSRVRPSYVPITVGRTMKPDSAFVSPLTRHKNHLPQPVSKPTRCVRNITGSGFVWVIQHRTFRLLPSGMIHRFVKSTADPITIMPVDRVPSRIFWM